MIGYSVADANRRCQPEHRGEELFRLEGYGGRVTLPTGDNQRLYSPISGVTKKNNRLIGSIGSIV